MPRLPVVVLVLPLVAAACGGSTHAAPPPAQVHEGALPGVSP